MHTPAGDHAAPAACDNCATPLSGEFCPHCGQHAHNPLRSFSHAVEDVFESFWHLDGRIVRTLRDLLFPGLLAARFLKGHRAPYVPPLRLFVVLSVLTFFVAQFALHWESPTVSVPRVATLAPGKTDPQPDPGEFAAQGTVAAVEAERDAKLTALTQANAQVSGVPGLAQFTQFGARKIRADAQARIHELDPSQPATLAAPANASGALPETQDADDGNLLGHFDPAKNPVHIDALPGFANRWINKKLARAQINFQRYSDDPAEALHVFIAAIPSALFVLVPVFAVLLKVAYLGSGRGYLEHLVVGLYSHAYMVLSLLALFLLMLIDGALPASAGWLSWILATLRVLLLLWIPIYLWLTQQRVYGEPWWLTTIKYVVIGNLYFMLVGMAALMVAFNGMTH
ncbi:Protein of unknown function [Pseudoxanthomonas sp. GM95]|uniref:DUF3667 domain-containing protein n=1 Tax=Pseudoxanthomonas sp. GM95 TaxID=1881043 RepID=UPI0008D3335E|nr:DUF3667 domain-containing protein [Pseudoxanthomonas sp. GM95]SEL54541.1 Protein of unknown function [Pseudoxanthomonas sp. GM95]